MTAKTSGTEPQQPKADHGASSEVTWDGGAGVQPYANQGPREAEEPNPSDDEVPEGNRGELSGRNQEQLDAVRKP
jgi:hypothetical protein